MKRQYRIELAVVLGVSLGASAIYSTLSLIRKLLSTNGLAGSQAVINAPLATQEGLDFAYQLAQNLIGLAPVGLVLYLMWLEREGVLKRIGLDTSRPARDTLTGMAMAASIGVPGIGLYFLARQLGLAAEVIPSALLGYWWTVPMLLLAALKAGLLEEVVVVAYLFDRLAKLGVNPLGTVLISALLRATYHLYQGFGGFIGNFIMGLIFGAVYLKVKRVAPLVVAHTLMDAAVFIGAPILLN